MHPGLWPMTWQEKKKKIEEVRAVIALFKMELIVIQEALRGQAVRGKEAQALWLRQRHLINAMAVEFKYLESIKGRK